MRRLCGGEPLFKALAVGRVDGSGEFTQALHGAAQRETELRAVGDVLVDQIAYMRRCGFDSFKPNAPLDDADVEAAFARWTDVYQKTIDGRRPIWAKRHQVA